MREIAPIAMPDVVSATISSAPPSVIYVPPGSLFVEEKYQRDLSDRSIRLIRKIVAEWDWSAFKPPICVDVEGSLCIVDGQHTAIAAVTHGGIETIPILVVSADSVATRASAFVRHNRDRVTVTPTALHAALVAAGDEDAMTLAQVCERAGVRILKNPPPFSRFAAGDTMAVSTMQTLIKRRFAKGARRVLETCVQGGAAPVSAALIRAVEHLLFAKEYAGEMDEARISAVIASGLERLHVEAERFAAERKVPFWRALASVIFMNRKKVRGGK